MKKLTNLLATAEAKLTWCRESRNKQNRQTKDWMKSLQSKLMPRLCQWSHRSKSRGRRTSRKLKCTIGPRLTKGMQTKSSKFLVMPRFSSTKRMNCTRLLTALTQMALLHSIWLQARAMHPWLRSWSSSAHRSMQGQTTSEHHYISPVSEEILELSKPLCSMAPTSTRRISMETPLATSALSTATDSASSSCWLSSLISFQTITRISPQLTSPSTTTSSQ